MMNLVQKAGGLIFRSYKYFIDTYLLRVFSKEPSSVLSKECLRRKCFTRLETLDLYEKEILQTLQHAIFCSALVTLKYFQAILEDRVFDSSDKFSSFDTFSGDISSSLRAKGATFYE